MTVNSTLSPVSLGSYFDPATGAVKQANLFFYHAGTHDPLSVFTDALLQVAHPVPVITTGYGRVPPVFIGEIPPPGYRVVVYDQYSQLIEDIDNLPGAAPGGGEEPGPAPGATDYLKTGDVLPAYTNGLARDGFARCNGGTIGSALSAATEVKADTAHDLFIHLWSQDQGIGQLVVTPGGRGAGAEGDWDANKAITVPDLRGRAIFGMDNMGLVDAGRLTGSVVDSPGIAGAVSPGYLGSYGGRSTHTLDLTQTPAHIHSIAAQTLTGTAASHTHGWDALSLVAAGAHTHPGSVTTAGEGSHQHTATSGGNTVAAGTGGSTAVGTSNSDTIGANSHQHNLTIASDGSHTHTITATIAYSGALAVTLNTPTLDTDIKGGGLAHPVTPPFLTLCFYIKL